MRSRLNLLVAALLAAPTTAWTQGPTDAVAVDPKHHQVLFENDHVRVFRALASPGDSSPRHTHPPFVFIGLATARLQLAVPPATNLVFDILPEQVLWLENAEHSWHMVAGLLHVIGVEVKAAKQGAPPAAVAVPSTDATIVDPAAHHVLLENDYVRVFEVLAPTGARSAMHTHSRGGVLVSLGRARVRAAMPNGATHMLDLHPGQALWSDPSEHSWELLSGPSRMVVVEVKSATGAR